MAHTEIGKYSVSVYGAGGIPEGARIWLNGTDGSTIGTIILYKDPAALQNKDDHQTSSGFVAIHQSADQLPKFLDVLRNEKPVFLGFASSWKTGYITTGQEPVGEEET